MSKKIGKHLIIRFVLKAKENLGYKTVVSIAEIPEAEAMAFFDWDAIVKAPVFK